MTLLLLLDGSGADNTADAQVAGVATLTANVNITAFASASLGGVGAFMVDQIPPTANLSGTSTLFANVTVDLDVYRSMIKADNPTGYWRLGESAGTTATDSSGNNRHGTYVATPTFNVAGALRGTSNKAITLNGSTQYVDLGSNAALNPTAATTVEAWFKTTSAATMNIYRWRSSGVDLRINGGTLQGVVYNASTSALLNSPRKYNDGKWHHAALTFDGTTVRLYVDAYLVASAALAGPVFYDTVTSGAAIGRDGNASSGYWSGSLDEVALYGTALSLAQIQARVARGAYQTGWFWDTPLASPRGSATAATANGVIYLIGGNGTEVLAYDIATRTWTTKAASPVEIGGGTAAALGNYIYVSYGSSLYRYDPVANTWATLASSPVFAQYHGMVPATSQNKLYVFPSTSTGAVYDVASDTWSTFTMVTPRYYAYAAEHANGKIYLQGGSSNRTLTQEFDPATRTFTTKLACPGTGHEAGQVVAFGGKIWSVGGLPTGTTAHSYDPSTNTWATEATMLRTHGDTAAAVLGGRLMVISGYFSGDVAETETYVGPALTATSVLSLGMGLSPDPAGDVELELELVLSGDVTKIEGTRVPSPGFIKMGHL
jgi:N-acetylneuraminic acid mutarotase